VSTVLRVASYFFHSAALVLSSSILAFRLSISSTSESISSATESAVFLPMNALFLTSVYVVSTVLRVASYFFHSAALVLSSLSLRYTSSNLAFTSSTFPRTKYFDTIISSERAATDSWCFSSKVLESSSILFFRTIILACALTAFSSIYITLSTSSAKFSVFSFDWASTAAILSISIPIKSEWYFMVFSILSNLSLYPLRLFSATAIFAARAFIFESRSANFES